MRNKKGGRRRMERGKERVKEIEISFTENMEEEGGKGGVLQKRTEL